MNPSNLIIKTAAPYSNIKIEANPEQARMSELIHNAQIHILITFQDTGLKLKLLNSLFAGRHTIVNSLMLAGSGLDSLCKIADTPEDMVAACYELMEQTVTQDDIDKRTKVLFPTFSNQEQGKRLYRLIFEEN